MEARHPFFEIIPSAWIFPATVDVACSERARWPLRQQGSKEIIIQDLDEARGFPIMLFSGFCSETVLLQSKTS